MRNKKRKDFDYYLTNLDWDDGSDIERDVKQFTRNDVFEHTYERPGFYSIKGLVFKYNELMVNALPPASLNMTDGYAIKLRTIENHPLNSGSFFGRNDGSNNLTMVEIGASQFNNIEVRSKKTIFEIQDGVSNELELDFNNVDEDDKFIIRESFNRDTPVFLASGPGVFNGDDWPNVISPPGEAYGKGALVNGYGVFSEAQEQWLDGSIVAMIEHRPRTRELLDSTEDMYSYYHRPDLFWKSKVPTSQLPGICINMPVKMSFAENDHIQLSVDLNLPNPNLNLRADDSNFGKSTYAVRIRMHPPKADGSTDWGIYYDDIVYVEGMGESFNKRAYNGGRGENDGWQTVKHVSFAQPKEEMDSEGNEIPDTSFDVIYIKIEVYPSSLSQLSQIPEQPEFAGDENASPFPGPLRQYNHIYHPANMQYMAMRNLSVKFPNTKGIIRPVEWQKFKSNVVVNPRIDYNSPLYEENKFAMIGGLSRESSHFKTLTSLISFDLESDEYKETSLNSVYNEYDVLSMYDTMAKYDDKYYNKTLEPYTRRIHEDYAAYDNRVVRPDNGEAEIRSSSLYNKPKITDGIIDRKTHGVFKDTSIIDVDIASTKVYTAVVPMWEQLGFENPIYNNPNNFNYWNNIIPKDYGLQNRTGVTQRNLPNPQKGSLTPRIPRSEYIVDESVDQGWQDNYRWPTLPQLNKLGVFVSGSVDEPAYGGKTRWDQDDELSLITNILNDNHSELKFNLNINVDEIEELQDLKSNLFLRYVTDWTLHLDENKRIAKDVVDQYDSINKSINKQAF